MSGFDFESLRDPEAPIPGSRERAGVNMRARHLRASQLRNRVAVSTTAFVVIAGAVLGVVAATRNTGPQISVEGGSTTTSNSTAPGRSVGHGFVPPATLENGKIVLPVTLPDGESVTLRYPPSMAIAKLGFAGSAGVTWPRAGSPSCCTASVSISYNTITEVYGDEKARAHFPGADGKPIPVYELGPVTPEGGGPAVRPRELAFQFGPWLARVSGSGFASMGHVINLPDRDVANLARGLTADVDERGYLVLHAQAPMSIAAPAAEFGQYGSAPEGSANVLTLAAHSGCGHVRPASTTPRAFPRLGTVESCVDKVLHVQSSGSAAFLNSALHDLEVSPLQPAPARPTSSTTTTTAPRVTSNDSAESSSWVSPQHGWALDSTGRIDETTDSGATWHAIGHVTLTSDIANRIRFADASHGFVFDAELYRTAPFMETVDGGRHWKKLQTPFTKISDLSISRGVVYVVGTSASAGPNGPFPGFRIWSSPARSLQWKVDPLVIPVGAGPVPTQQLVLSGDTGWLINSDRGIVSGARLSPQTGTWSTWNPPCRDVRGSASLAASTSTDLVALCSPGFATASTTTYIEFSHDGGATFHRQTVPGGRNGAGGPLTPDAHTAVIGQGVNLQRTTDDGATWTVVLNHDPNLVGQRDTLGYAEMVDFGFTTATQGFIITDSGAMLMTFDAGSTWQKVTLP